MFPAVAHDLLGGKGLSEGEAVGYFLVLYQFATFRECSVASSCRSMHSDTLSLFHLLFLREDHCCWTRDQGSGIRLRRCSFAAKNHLCRQWRRSIEMIGLPDKQKRCG